MYTNLNADISESDVAVVGMGGRFPGMGSVEDLWRGLREGREGVRRFTEEELLSAGVDEATLSDGHYVRAGALLEAADVFDAEFFGFTPREAEILDPQQRILLECSWEALERAGYDPWRMKGSTGVYVGTSLSMYLLRYLFPNRELLESAGTIQVLLSNDMNFLATRLAYKLNLRGPGLTVQTACSTSLVAVHLACQALIGGECDLALAGGVAVKDYRKYGYRYQPGGLLSADGRCRSFDAGATGTVSGNGAGVVVLKRLGEALADGDRIHAVIRGSAINNDGAVKAGYTAPAIEGQANVIAEALSVAGVDSATIGYVEAHGSGTELGDPIEVAALREAFGECGGKRQFCALGSVKSNIGHLDAAAGVAGLIKAVLAVREGEIPASLHFERPNPKIDFERSPFYVNTELRRWEVDGGERRRAGVSSFGIGGTNAHVVLEQAPEMPARGEARDGVELLVLSARTATALAESRRRLAEHLESHDDVELADVSWTLQVGRREFRHREAIVCGSTEQAIRALRGEDASAVIGGLASEMPRPVSLLLCGAGDQYAGMGKGLYELGGRYREELERCCELLRRESGEDVLGELHRDRGASGNVLRAWRRGESVDAGRLGETVLGQSAVFAVDYALAQMWMQWGIRPKALLGYSLGEYAAACLAGVMRLEDAVRVVVNRARLIAQAPAGAMVTVGLDADEAESYLSGRLEVAIDSGKGACVVGGPVEEVEAFERKLGERGVVCRRQSGNCAMHTQMMKPVAKLLEEVLRGVRLQEPQLGYIGNLSGRLVQPGELTKTGYWTAHLWQRVRFRQGLEELLKDEGAVLLEVGPGQSLSSFAQQTSLAKGRPVLVTGSLRNQHEEWSDEEYLRRSTGKLWTGGIAVDWKAMHDGAGSRRRVELPTYAFEGKRYWAGVEEGQEKKLPSMELKKLADPAQWLYAPTWKRTSQAHREQEETAVRWLVFSDGSGLSRAVVSRLTDAEVVDRGDALAKTGEHAWTIQPDRREDYSALFDRLRAEERLPDRILYLWNLQDVGEDEFFSFFFLSQALGEIDYAREMRLFVVSSGTELIETSDELEPGRCLLKGICRALPQEYGNLQCRHIDVRLEGEEEQLAAAIVGELRSKETEEFVGLRGRYRWVPGYAPVRTDRAAGEAKLRRHGVYLITGGLGGMGLTLAGYLARTQQARLVLVGWRGLPERERWERWLEEHGPEEETSRRIAQVREMEEAGAEVLVLEADVADPEQMREVVEQTHRRFGAIHGVIHAAGVAGGGLLHNVDAVQRVLRPKVAGTRELWRAVAPDAPDFLLLCSSLGSILGGIGQADYYAANAFQDAFAHTLNNDSTTAVAVNWDVWKNVGMALRITVSATVARLRDEWIRHGITPLEGVEVFLRAIGGWENQIVASTQNLGLLADQHRVASVARWAKVQLQSENPNAKEGREGLSTEWVAARTDLEAQVAAIWGRVVGRTQIGVYDNFFELGGSSLMGIQLLHRIREATGIALPLGSLFSAPTIDQLCSLIERTEQAATSPSIEQIANMDKEQDEDILRKVDEMSEEEIDKALAELEGA